MSLCLCLGGLSARATLGGNGLAGRRGASKDERVGAGRQSEEANFGGAKRRHPVEERHCEAEEATRGENDDPEKAGRDDQKRLQEDGMKQREGVGLGCLRQDGVREGAGHEVCSN